MGETQSDTVGRGQTTPSYFLGASDFVLNPTTAHKQFNRQTDLLGGRGNVIARTFFKWHIAKDQMRHDLRTISVFEPSAFVEDRIWRAANRQDIYVSVLFHTNSNSRLKADTRITHGFILSDTEDYLLSYYTTGPTWKSASVVLECLPYVTLLSSIQEMEWLNQIDRFRKEWMQP